MVNYTLKKVKEEVKKLPNYEEVEKMLQEKMNEWRVKTEEYCNYVKMPDMVDETIPILDAIIMKSMNKQKLRKDISEDYNFIIDEMKKMGAIKTIAKLTEGEMKPQLVYKGRETNPQLVGRSELAFYSLAILTALGYHFGMPVIMDEVGNNLDKDKFPMFFNLAIGFKNMERFRRNKILQYVFVVLDRPDFNLDGWVKELAEKGEIEIYEVKEGNIKKKELIS